MFLTSTKQLPMIEQKACCSRASLKTACQWLFSADTCLRIGLFLCLGAVLTVLWWFFEYVKIGIAMSLTWIQQIGLLYGSIALASLIIIQALLFLPCLPFTLGAGFLYGCVTGSIIVHVASTIAAFIGFMLSRYIARGCLEKRLMSKSGDSTWRKIDQAIEQDGFKLVFLIRFSPLHPYGLCNYLFGLTSVSLRDYMLGSFFGMMPTTIVEVYFGTAIKSFADIVGDASGAAAETVVEDTSSDSGTFFWFGLAATLAVTVYMTVWIKRKLNTHLDGYQHVDSDARDVEMLELGHTVTEDDAHREEHDDIDSEIDGYREENAGFLNESDNEPDTPGNYSEDEQHTVISPIPAPKQTSNTQKSSSRPLPVHSASCAQPGSVPALARPQQEPESPHNTVKSPTNDHLPSNATPQRGSSLSSSGSKTSSSFSASASTNANDTDRERAGSIACVAEDRPYAYADLDVSISLSVSSPSKMPSSLSSSATNAEICEEDVDKLEVVTKCMQRDNSVEVGAA